ncbi:hemerythrin domain-containing protein [Castellaniella sp. GW247-6E4]|uniref:hemerythrin domain-containing protein n=1 Tax=Castellaniella sp. GW247-6E4 TaxID=3140380 RepID=UPI003314B27B
MKENYSVARLLENQHRDIDDALKNMVGQGLEVPDCSHALERLRFHIYLEEAFIFPILENRGAGEWTLNLKQDHGEIWRCMESFHENSRERACAGSRKTVSDLHDMLRIHDDKEEELIYPVVDVFIKKYKLASTFIEIDSARLPENWICLFGEARDS